MCERVCVCVCVHAQLSECMRTDTWRSPSLAAHIVESSLPVWAILYLSLSLSLFPFYSLCLSFVLFSLPFSFAPRVVSLPLRAPTFSSFCLGSPLLWCRIFIAWADEALD